LPASAAGAPDRELSIEVATRALGEQAIVAKEALQERISTVRAGTKLLNQGAATATALLAKRRALDMAKLDADLVSRAQAASEAFAQCAAQLRAATVPSQSASAGSDTSLPLIAKEHEERAAAYGEALALLQEPAAAVELSAAEWDAVRMAQLGRDCQEATKAATESTKTAAGKIAERVAEAAGHLLALREGKSEATPPASEAADAGFAGVWSKGTITEDCTKLSWNREFEDEEEASVKVDGNRITLELRGKFYHGQLVRSVILWSDGDIWERSAQTRASPPQADASAVSHAWPHCLRGCWEKAAAEQASRFRRSWDEQATAAREALSERIKTIHAGTKLLHDGNAMTVLAKKAAQDTANLDAAFLADARAGHASFQHSAASLRAAQSESELAGAVEFAASLARLAEEHEARAEAYEKALKELSQRPVAAAELSAPEWHAAQLAQCGRGCQEATQAAARGAAAAGRRAMKECC
jgi:hypothetical protein